MFQNHASVQGCTTIPKMSFAPPPKKQKKAASDEVELELARDHHMLLMEWYVDKESMKKALHLWDSYLKNNKIDLQNTGIFNIGYFNYIEHLVVNDIRINSQEHIDRFVLYIRGKARRCNREMYERHVQYEKENNEEMAKLNKTFRKPEITPISTSLHISY